MNKTELIQKILGKNGIELANISNREIKGIICDYDIWNEDEWPVRIFNKQKVVSKLLDYSGSNDIEWYRDMQYILDKIDNDCVEFKFCPNCGCKLPNDNCCHNHEKKKEEEPEKSRRMCTTWCKCYEPQLIRNIHVESDCIKFTHSNDIDTVTTMEHSSVQEFSDSANRNGSFINKLKSMNLDNSITLYNCKLPYRDSIKYMMQDSSYHSRDNLVDKLKAITSFGCFLNALGQIGYRIQHKPYEGYGDFHIVYLKKEEEC